MKIVTVIGARPQFVKAAALSRELRKNHQEILVHTGQHYDKNMSDIFFEELGIPNPDYNLEVGSWSHGKQTGIMLEKIEKLLMNEKPDALLVYGDTNSTIAGALAASKLHIPVIHVEAGLRSFNMKMPEEQNRILTDHISTLLLCPTENSVRLLAKEGITEGVFNTGDIMFDTVLNNIKIAEEKYSDGSWVKELNDENNLNLEIKSKDFYLATIHRPDNTDNLENLKVIFESFEKLEKKVIVPLHPRTVSKLANLGIQLNNVVIIKPVGYLMMLWLLKNSYMSLTDSGGLQKEAYFLQVPCTTFRDQTEWIETLVDGWNVLTHINEQEILDKINRDLSFINKEQPQQFGNGETAKEIVRILEERFDNNVR